MNDDTFELIQFAKWALICGIAYMVTGPVGLACVALIALCKYAKKNNG